MIRKRRVRIVLTFQRCRVTALCMPTYDSNDRLTPEECAEVRRVVETDGLESALRCFMIREALTLLKADHGLSVHRLTVITIRSRLAVMRTSAE
jgi:hypothetical protein